MDGLYEATGLQLAQDLRGGETAWAAGAIGPRRHVVSGPAGRDLRAPLRADTLRGSEQSGDLERPSLLEGVLVAPDPFM